MIRCRMFSLSQGDWGKYRARTMPAQKTPAVANEMMRFRRDIGTIGVLYPGIRYRFAYGFLPTRRREYNLYAPQSALREWHHAKALHLIRSSGFYDTQQYL